MRHVLSSILAVAFVLPAAAQSSSDALLSRGVWQDTRTNLVWARCSVGQTWSGNSCTGKVLQPPYQSKPDPENRGSSIPDPDKNAAEMVQALATFDLGGFKDWRLPTIGELQALLPCADGTQVPEAAGQTLHFRCANGQVPRLDPSIFPDATSNSYPNAYQPVSRTASASNRCGGPCYQSLEWQAPYIGSNGKVRWQGTKIIAVRSDTPLVVWSTLQKAAPETARAQQLKEEQDRRAAEEQAKAFLSLGKCAVGESVIHREAVNASQSSGNPFADLIWNSQTKAQYIIEYEAIVEGFLGSKVKTIINGYTVKQLSKGGYVDSAEMRAKVSSVADKLVGKTQFYDRSRCAK